MALEAFCKLKESQNLYQLNSMDQYQIAEKPTQFQIVDEKKVNSRDVCWLTILKLVFHTYMSRAWRVGQTT